jgi:hypothetical protein
MALQRAAEDLSAQGRERSIDFCPEIPFVELNLRRPER